MNPAWEDDTPIVPLWKRKLIQLFLVGTSCLLAGILIGWQLDHLAGPQPIGPPGPRLLPVPPSVGVDDDGTGKDSVPPRVTAQDTRPLGSGPKAVSQ